jgi:hypothetical protein
MTPGGAWGKHAITVDEGARMIFDYVSVSWGCCETFSVSSAAANITVQATIIV